MLDFGTYLRLRPVLRSLSLRERVVSRGLVVGKILGTGRMLFDDLGLTRVCRIFPDTGFLPLQQMRQGLAVMHIGSGECHRMDELDLAVRPNVRLHAEMPLIALLGLLHFGVARFLLVLGRGWGADDGGVHNRPLGNLEAAPVQVASDFLEDLPAQIVPLQQMAKLAESGFIRHRLLSQINARKLAHRHRVIQRFFHRRILEIKPVLQAVDSNYPLQINRPTAVTGSGIHRRHQRAKPAPRNQPLHLRQKRRPPRRFCVAFESCSGQCHLLHLLPPESSRMASTTHKTFDQMTYSVSLT